jgi:hypothetical protein
VRSLSDLLQRRAGSCAILSEDKGRASVATDILVYLGGAVITLWGIAHIAPTKSVVAGFGAISEDNRRIITMEWAAEGLTLSFIGLLVLLVTAVDGSQNSASLSVYRVSAAMLLVMAGWTLLTGARTSILPIKICPVVKTAVAVLFLVGSVL